MGRSNSRSHSSRSKSRSRSSSRSRSRSHSRKKRYSSRSRSRTYSRSRSRERMYNRDNRENRDMRDMRDNRDNRDYHRDFRNNRGMRRPYGFRPMRRGFFPGGGGGRFMHRGGFRPMWNRRHSRSPRRGRSRSRTPKRRSVSSQRSRSRSHRSYRSSRSPGSSSSGSSSQYSKSPPVRTKKRVSREKKAKKSRSAPTHDSPLNSKSLDEPKDTFERDPSESLDEFSKASGVCGDTWAGLSAYDNSPRSPCSPSPVASPSSLSSSDSDTPILSTAKNTTSRSVPHSPESIDNGSDRYSPSQNSPLHNIPSKRSPAKTAPSEESRAGELELMKGGKLGKRYTDEEARIHSLDRGNTREKELQKDRVLEKGRKEGGIDWEDIECLDFFNDKGAKKTSFLNVSEGADSDETEDYRQFRKSVLADQGKTAASASHWNTEEDETKFASKLLLRGARDSDVFREEKSCRAKEFSHGGERASTTREKEDKGSEKVLGSKENQSSDEQKSEKLKDLFNYSPLHKMESREKSSFREESPLRIKMVASESHRPEVKLKTTTLPLDDTDRTSSLMNDRLLASTLVHSVSKDQEFRSIFDHLKLPQSSKTSSESFIEHIVALVHHVQVHYFKSASMTLHERFGDYQKATEDPATQQKSPEIHRRIDISPSTLKKHTRLAGEDKVFKEIAPKTDKKLKGTATDKRSEVERRRKHRSKERGNSKGSRESSGSRKQEKLLKEYKEFKLFKDESKRKNKEQERSRSPSSSSSSREEKSNKKEREEDFRSQQEQKEYSGFAGVTRPRGTFFRIRGRGRARGIFAGTNTAPPNLNAPPFPKRPPEEEWDPEYTPKSKKYFLHDDRDDGVDYWASRGRGRGTFQRGRGRFTFKKSGSSPKWTHDKYQGDGLVEDEDEAMENNEERKDGHQEEKVDNSGLPVN